jgi:hypothetical protein
MCRLSWNLGPSTCWNPQGLYRPVMGLFYVLHICGVLRGRLLAGVTQYNTGESGFISRLGQRGFFRLPDRLWGPTHPPLQLTGVRGVKRRGHKTKVSYLLPITRMCGALPPLPTAFSWHDSGLELQLCFLPIWHNRQHVWIYIYRMTHCFVNTEEDTWRSLFISWKW